MLCQQARRLLIIFRFVRSPSQLELRLSNIGVAGICVDGCAEEGLGVRVVSGISRNLSGCDDGARRPIALRKEASHFVRSVMSLRPLPGFRVSLRKVVESFRASLARARRHKVERGYSVHSALGIESGDAAMKLGLRIRSRGEALEGNRVSVQSSFIAFRFKKFLCARDSFFGCRRRIGGIQARDGGFGIH